MEFYSTVLLNLSIFRLSWMPLEYNDVRGETGAIIMTASPISRPDDIQK